METAVKPMLAILTGPNMNYLRNAKDSDIGDLPVDRDSEAQT